MEKTKIFIRRIKLVCIAIRIKVKHLALPLKMDYWDKLARALYILICFQFISLV